jgi:uncharacterized protein (TIGR02186 family)
MAFAIICLLQSIAHNAQLGGPKKRLLAPPGGPRPWGGLRKRVRHGFAVLLVLATVFANVFASARTASAQIVADISDHLIAITTGFTGAELLLFGAAENGTVVVVVRGPRAPFVVRRKARIAGIWINRTEMAFRNVPHYYAIASSQPLDTIPYAVRARHEMGTDALRLQAPKDVDPKRIPEYRQALIRNMQNNNLYYREPARVNFLGSQLFRVDIRFPANAPVGLYEVFVYLVRDGDVISAQSSPLHVSRIGLEAWIFDFAHRRSWSYGVLAIGLAVMAGWGASLIFHKE